MLEETIAGLGAGRLEYRAVHPTVALVVHGIGALHVGEAAVLRLERRLQVGRIVDGMGPGVAGEQLKAMGEPLREIKGQSVVPGIAVGELRVDAVEGNGHAEAFGIASQTCQKDLRCVSDSKGLSWRDKTSEGRIGAGGPEEVEEGRRGHESDCRCRGAVRCGEALPESAWSNQEDTAGTRRDARIARAGGNDDGQRVADAKPRSGGIERVLREQMGVSGINVLSPGQVRSASPLVTETEFPGAGDL